MFGDLERWIKEGDILDKLHAIVGLNKLLIDDATAPYMEVIDANLVHVLINFVNQHEYTFLQIKQCVLSQI